MPQATQSYKLIRREIKQGQQHIYQEEAHLHLFQDKVTTASHEFALHEVHDMSYRRFSAGFVFFYLHTIRGVFSYLVTTSPDQFIDTYQQIK
ncbi:hypothetical protein [Bacillus xiapuensis]|uniref:hypothetical protein n=1 Tax=Bacillus xiapuensis TaxID=2014075 RepID=UPI000C24BEC2|nr:hypothetical protein [Bacillus xiapuensis]